MALTTSDAVAEMLRWGDAEKTKFEAQLAPYIAAASEVVEAEAGPFAERTVTHIADGGASSIALPFRVSSITTVEVGSSTGGAWVGGYYVPVNDWDSFSGWTLDAPSGLLYGPFPSGRQNIKVTYVTGFNPVPDSAKLAATMVAADMWAVASQRAPSLDEQFDPVYLMPKLVRNLLAPFKATQMPGFA